MIDFDQKDLDQFHEYMAKRNADRIELEQYRAIFAKLEELLERGGELHTVKNVRNSLRLIRVIDLVAGDETIESVHGETLRDAMAQAAQVVA